jgi:periplasmic protein TonB
LNILDQNWDDLIFEDRYKEYGAYALRRKYPVYVSTAALIVIVLFLAVMYVPPLFKEKPNDPIRRSYKAIDYVVLKPPPSINKIKIPGLSAAKQVEPKIANPSKPKFDKLVVPKVVKEELVVEDAVAVNEEVEIVAALHDWMRERLEYPEMARRMGIEGSVIVEFTVDVNGNILDARIKESSDKMFADKVMDVIRTMPGLTIGAIAQIKSAKKYLLPVGFILY